MISGKFIFISYASQNQNIALKICEQLETQGVCCWIAPRDITPGQSYGTEIVKALEQADGLILVLTSEANKSLMVQKEVERAVSKSKTVYPFRLENLQPSEGLEFFISSSHWIDAFDGNFNKGISSLVNAIQGAYSNHQSIHGQSIIEIVNSKQSQAVVIKDINVREFQFHKSRGILINGADGSRNIAFKVETINNIFSQIRFQIEKLTETSLATSIFRQSGYAAGINFGRVMNEKWELASEFINLNEKVTKWCEFDSDVGWGRLENKITIDENEGAIQGEIRLTENFLIFNKGKSTPCECHFMVGYTQGVLEEIFSGVSLSVACNMDVCPLSNPLKKVCVIKINNVN